MRSSRTLFFKTLGFAVLMVLLGLSVPGCINPPDYPDTPEIDFQRISIQSILKQGSPFDSINIAISYRDGDGDLGLGQNDTLPPFNPRLPDKTPNPNTLNYFCQAQIRQTDGTYVNYNPPAGTLSGRYPNLTPESQADRKAPLRGEIYYAILFSPIGSPPPGTVMRFKVSIQDRALHRSNEVVTDPITIPQ